jgi:hypothetical protein
MHKLTTLALCAMLSQPLLAQQSQTQLRYFEGVSLSVGVASNRSNTTAAFVEEGKSSTLGVAKLSYTLPSTTIFKLGLSLGSDLNKSELSSNVSMSRNTPTELTLEPGVLLTPYTLAYTKLGGYSATYTTPYGSQGVSGTAVGVGVKAYLTHRVFLQGELTQHRASGSTSLGWDKFKQTSTAILVGYNY